MSQLFLDVDGVLADFNGYVSEHILDGVLPRHFEEKYGRDALWSQIRGHPNTFAKLPLLPDAMELYDAVKHLNPIFLTGAPRFFKNSPLYGQIDKILWVEEHFGRDQCVFICESQHKAEYCKPGDILVDDWPKYRYKWVERGGIWITHTSAKQTINDLKRLGVL